MDADFTYREKKHFLIFHFFFSSCFHGTVSSAPEALILVVPVLKALSCFQLRAALEEQDQVF